MMKKVKCKDCKREFTDQPKGDPVKVYEHEGEFLCKDCLVDRGLLPPHDADEHDHIVWEYLTLFPR